MSTNTNSNAVRVTKIMKLEAIKGLIPETATITFPGDDKKAPYVFDHAEIMAFIDKELDQLARKNSSGDKKETEDQKAREQQKQDILDYLATLPEFDDEGKPFPGATCSDVLKNVPSMAGYQVQKPSGLLRQLREAKPPKVVVTSIKGRSYFKLA